MHLIYDDNGNLVPHGAGHEHGHEVHTHEHTHDGHTHEHPHSHEEGHEHDHSHSHGHGQPEHCHEQHCHEGECGSAEKCKNETVMLLEYMKNHNEQHAAELDQMAARLDEQGLHDAAKQIRDGVSDFQKGNMRLSLALALVKEQLKEA